MGIDIPQTPPQAGLHAFSGVGQQPEQYRPAYQRYAGHQAEQLREAETLGMGTYPGQTVQGFDQEPDTRTDTGSRRYVHRPDQECYHLVPCRQCRHQWGNDARYDDGHAVHHRPAQRPHIAVHQFRAGHAGCENLARTPERNSGKTG